MFLETTLLLHCLALSPSMQEIPPAPVDYLGRTIARTMHFSGAPWLVRESREREEEPALMLAQLGVEPGMTICDLGCGNGFYTLPLAQMTGPEGTVFAVDIQPEMLELLDARAADAGLDNIELTIGNAIDPMLPEAAVDLVLLVDVYHEMSHPEPMLVAIRKALKPDGRIVLVEFRAEDPDVPIKPLHKMSKAQVNRELTANGFELVGDFDGLPWQHMMSFSKTAVPPDAAPNPAPVQVFILAGQSNMEGQGVVDLDHPEYYNGGRGTLERVMAESDDPGRYAHLKDDDGQWVVRDDVRVRFCTMRGVKSGRLSIGFTGYPGAHHIGPEFQFGNVVGDAIDADVLLVKTAWGGKSLFRDFRPPSAGGEVGPFYTRMIAEVRAALAELEVDRLHGGRGHELGGFVWMQGWNDMGEAQARAEYEDNLAALIRDVRSEFAVPALPVVIGELGNGGPDASPDMQVIRSAQRAAAARPEFAGTVAFVETHDFARPAEESPNRGHGHHWFGNAESYFLIGDALGRAMLELIVDDDG